MCWSFGVSAAFGGCELLVLLYLWFRNIHYDRFYVLICVPLCGQELCQMMLWLHVGTDSDTCPAANRSWTKVAIMFSGSVSFVSCVVALLVSEHPKAGVDMMKQLLRGCTVAAFVSYLWLLSNTVADNHCSHPGACGHLLWTRDHGSELDAPIWLGYNLPMACICLLRCADGRLMGKWTFIGFMGHLLLAFLVHMHFQFVDGGACMRESGSIWCWSSFLLFVWFLVEVRLYCWLVDANWCPPVVSHTSAGTSPLDKSTIQVISGWVMFWFAIVGVSTLIARSAGDPLFPAPIGMS